MKNNYLEGGMGIDFDVTDPLLHTRGMYNKLFTQILDSSVWILPDRTRLVFLTLMAAKDETGFARFGTLQNLADRARVPLEDAAAAVATLEAPEPETATPEDDGRRIERVPGGWLVIKGPIYDAIARREHEKERVRVAVAEHRARKASAADVTAGNGVKRKVTKNNASDADADADTNKKTVARPKVPLPDRPWLDSLSAMDCYRHVNVLHEHEKMLLWCMGKKKVPTRARFIAWLNRIEAPMRPVQRTRDKSPAPTRPVTPDDEAPRPQSEAERLRNLEIGKRLVGDLKAKFTSPPSPAA